MKFILATLAVLATSVLAAPAPDAAAEPWCMRPGQSCWKKRDASPAAEAVTEDKRWCMRPGQSCWKAKRDAEDKRWCMRPGQSCWKAKRAAEAFAEAIGTSGGLQARDAAADLSNLRGGAAFTAKRAVNELANTAAATEDDPFAYYFGLGLDKEFHADSDDKGKRDALPAPWCMRPGQSCWKNKRDANPEADAEAVAEDKRWCMRPGQSCWKAKRAAEAVLEAVGSDDEDLDDKPFDPAYFAKRDAQPWCMRPGQSCWKRDASPEPWCMRPGQSCWKAKRDVTAMRTVARSIVDSFN
ncbi:hypothetical protein EDB81DRAFT_90582 [Dactylonectria macrodidyma]|uniref:Clock-controlled pheromone ccg-4 n=1 Tax=Dactylonectria macrodidyma TaxID=307937 RepID=A0A9P9E7Q1_9HYPO|nr:hypothetical protein EDB81DRAFT_90582 [Dactylonectria macrodidyma]